MSMEMNKAPVEQAGGDERAAFEQWLEQHMSHHFSPELDLAKYKDSGEYRYNPAGDYWKAWQARAALAQPSPTTDSRPAEWSSYDPTWVVDFIRDNSIFNADLIERMLEYATLPAGDVPQAEQAEAERPEVVAYADPVAFATFKERGHEGGVAGREWMWAEPGAALVAMSRTDECERIVGALRAERDGAIKLLGQSVWQKIQLLTQERDAANARLHEVATACATAEQQRDAALARVAELKTMADNYCALLMDANTKLAELEKKESAQAQHSVPEEFSFEYRHPNGESHTVTVSRDQVINEMPDFLFEALCSKFCNCEPVGETNVVECSCDEYAEEFKLLAAAPGKEAPQAWIDVQAERRRQITAEGWTPEHDDGHACDEIAAFACYYAMPPAVREWDASSTGYGDTLGEAVLPEGWEPKTGDRRRDLIKACALALAEIERLDRAAPGKEVGHE
ncbi:TPA: hypothetical protein ACXNHW_005989 [Pseudomonas aeruginosa]